MMPCMGVEVKAYTLNGIEYIPIKNDRTGNILQSQQEVASTSGEIMTIPATGEIGGVLYPIQFVGHMVNGTPTVDTLPLLYSGSITFTNNVNINNLHVLAADSVSAAPGVVVNVDALIVIGNNTKISGLNVNTLITPQSANEAAKQSYVLLAPQNQREMSAEEQSVLGRDLFGANFRQFAPHRPQLEDPDKFVPPKVIITEPPIIEPSEEIDPEEEERE